MWRKQFRFCIDVFLLGGASDFVFSSLVRVDFLFTYVVLFHFLRKSCVSY